MGAAISSTQFYVYGRKHFTQTGYHHARANYKDPVQTSASLGLGQKGADGVNMKDKVVVITGANSGVGQQMTEYAVGKGAKVFMICRSEDKAKEAKRGILESVQRDPPVQQEDLEILLCDVSEIKQVKQCVEELKTKTEKVDVLVCNAGALLNERKENSEGNEITFASHLLGGSYAMSTLMLPLLKQAGEEARVIFTSSGGMYANPWPSWEEATSQGKYAEKYEGNQQYSFAKRGQVILAEMYTKKHPDIAWVSTHPGWTSTAAVESAYGSQKKYLEPMREPWEGAEGITWLMAAKKDKLESGAFYLDRSTQRKHVSGPFMTEGQFSKNTEEEKEKMMTDLRTAAGI